MQEKRSEEIRISHENNLWRVFRILAEEDEMPAELSNRIRGNLGLEKNS